MSVRMWNYRGTRTALFFSFHKCLPLAGPSARLWWWRWKESLPASEESLSPWRHVWPGDCLTPMGMSPRCSHLEEALWLGWVCWENSQGGCFLTTEEELWIRAYIGNLGLKLGRNWNWLPKKHLNSSVWLERLSVAYPLPSTCFVASTQPHSQIPPCSPIGLFAAWQTP